MALPSVHATRSNSFVVWDAARKNRSIITGPLRPIRIGDNVVDTAKWAGIAPPADAANANVPAAGGKARRTRRTTIARRNRQIAERTLQHVVGRADVLDDLLCAACDAPPDECPGAKCRARFRRRVLAASAAAVELRHTGDDRLGYGVFVRPGRTIRDGDWLGEYLGEVMPKAALPNTSAYAFELQPATAAVDATRCGSWTRFVNHACQPNVEAITIAVGGRLGVLYRAVDDIGPGKELRVNYGPDYFRALGKLCVCNAEPAPHKPTWDDDE